MSKKRLLIAILILGLSSKTLGSFERMTLNTTHGEHLASLNLGNQVKLILLGVESQTLPRESAVQLLYNLGCDLPRNTVGIADIIDALGDLGAIKEGLQLLNKQGL